MALADPQGDPDNDGLTNSQESTHGTDPSRADTDCDGIEDGPEASYWNQQAPSSVNAYLRNQDVDGDGLLDGEEIAGGGTRGKFRGSDPQAVDTDGDWLWDGSEIGHSGTVKSCADSGGSMSTPSDVSLDWLAAPVWAPAGVVLGQAGSALLDPVPGPLVEEVLGSNGAGLPMGVLHQDGDGIFYAVDEVGVLVHGAYGVSFYPPQVGLEGVQPLSASASSSIDPECNNLTQRMERDSDSDGLHDGEECTGSRNPHKGDRFNDNRPGGNTDPSSADSDGDSLSDGIELGVNDKGKSIGNAWMTNPNQVDTDGDGKNDNVEDPDGVNDLEYDDVSGVYSVKDGGVAASSPIDADTDDDGLPDGRIGTLVDSEPLKWDRDGDGLSDGLEMGVFDRVKIDGSYTNGLGIPHTVTDQRVHNLPGWYTYQPFEGMVRNSEGKEIDPSECKEGEVCVAIATTPVDDPDKDNDGLLDGLEDWNHNGKWEDNALYGSLTRKELNPDGPDSDKDGLGDGRELLVFIRPTAADSTLSFGDLFSTKGFTVEQLLYDSGNVWETDPRLPDTDTDGVLDGKDMNPRLESNFVALTLAGFEFLDKDIDSWGEFDIEMFVSPISVKMPFVGEEEYVISMNPASSVKVRYRECDPDCNERTPYGPLPDALIEEISKDKHRPIEPSVESFDASYTGTIWKVKRVTSEPIIRFQLPEGIDQVNPADIKVIIKIQLMDEDVDNHDTLDINADPDRSKKYGEFTLDLLADTAGTFHTETFGSETFDYFDHHQFRKMFIGNHDKSASSNDAKLGIEVGDTIPRHFADALKITKGGGVAHFDKVVGGDGKDFFGNQGDL